MYFRDWQFCSQVILPATEALAKQEERELPGRVNADTLQRTGSKFSHLQYTPVLPQSAAHMLSSSSLGGCVLLSSSQEHKNRSHIN